MNQIKTLLNKDKFVEWLNTKPEDAIVGIAGDPYSCPIANYLLDNAILYDNQMITVSRDNAGIVNKITLTASKNSEVEILPEWAKEFILAVDSRLFNTTNEVTKDIAQLTLAQMDYIHFL